MARNQTFDEKIKRERNEIEKKKARTKGGREGGREGMEGSGSPVWKDGACQEKSLE